MIRTVYRKDISDSEIFDRINDSSDISEVVGNIIKDVKARGDEALIEYALRFDRAKLDSLEVTKAEINTACESVGNGYIGMLERAAANIRDFHSRQVRRGFVCNSRNGVLRDKRCFLLKESGYTFPEARRRTPRRCL